MKFNFDVKLFATVYIDAETEEDARALIDDIVPGLVEGGVWIARELTKPICPFCGRAERVCTCRGDLP